ncbi:MAG TPA: phytanoyl-CoA dioxygenase family protein [Allosphingosinicella sp.]|nr:phytanoyl-CoA dioxygenase family protein [Allosphingosinicella sp.]
MQLDPDGAERFAAAFTPDEIAALAALFEHQSQSSRLGRVPGLAPLLAPALGIAERLLGPAARPVRAIFFDKNAEKNWALGWHQDRTIAVCARYDHPGFTAWTVKTGIDHVVPPFSYLESMLTLRIHLDDAGPDNAPLLVAPGSHRLGRIAEPDIAPAIARLGARPCLAAAGDVWAYRAPVLHASERARTPARRRVVQLFCSAEDLPGGLEWLGV